ncbi:MAG: hypothetical protein AAFQ98_22655, partial [Bacteroidota bacterium]
IKYDVSYLPRIWALRGAFLLVLIRGGCGRFRDRLATGYTRNQNGKTTGYGQFYVGSGKTHGALWYRNIDIHTEPHYKNDWVTTQQKMSLK